MGHHMDPPAAVLTCRSCKGPVLTATTRLLRVTDAFTDMLVIKMMLQKVCGVLYPGKSQALYPVVRCRRRTACLVTSYSSLGPCSWVLLIKTRRVHLGRTECHAAEGSPNPLTLS